MLVEVGPPITGLGGTEASSTPVVVIEHKHQLRRKGSTKYTEGAGTPAQFLRGPFQAHILLSSIAKAIHSFANLPWKAWLLLLLIYPRVRSAPTAPLSTASISSLPQSPAPPYDLVSAPTAASAATLPCAPSAAPPPTSSSPHTTTWGLVTSGMPGLNAVARDDSSVVQDSTRSGISVQSTSSMTVRILSCISIVPLTRLITAAWNVHHASRRILSSNLLTYCHTVDDVSCPVNLSHGLPLVKSTGCGAKMQWGAYGQLSSRSAQRTA